MPVLYHDKLVGKVDIAADRDASCLTVQAVHEDVAFTCATRTGLTAELDALAAWLGLDNIF